MAWTFCNGKAIGKQIADRIAVDILNGAILPQQRLPAVDDMSKLTGASANTVAQAYDELLRDGIIEDCGVLVISSDLSAANRRREAIVRDAISRLATELTELGLPRRQQLILFGEILIEQSNAEKALLTGSSETSETKSAEVK